MSSTSTSSRAIAYRNSIHICTCYELVFTMLKSSQLSPSNEATSYCSQRFETSQVSLFFCVLLLFYNDIFLKDSLFFQRFWIEFNLWIIPMSGMNNWPAEDQIHFILTWNKKHAFFFILACCWLSLVPIWNYVISELLQPTTQKWPRTKEVLLGWLLRFLKVGDFWENFLL